jgi:hypothetical protein
MNLLSDGVEIPVRSSIDRVRRGRRKHSLEYGARVGSFEIAKEWRRFWMQNRVAAPPALTGDGSSGVGW